MDVRPPRRRDRRGRGIRGPLAPAGLPIALSRAEQFDDVVIDAVEQVRRRWGNELESVDFAVEDVPPASVLGRDTFEPVPLGGLVLGDNTRPPRVVVYRRPVQARAQDPEELADLVLDVVIEEVAELLGLEPGTIDPGYDGDE
jgi:predicted Zn-dependent protease with MMP-like domain